MHPDPGTSQHAQRLPSSFQTARVTAQIEGNAEVLLRFPEEPVSTGSRPSLSRSFPLLSPRIGLSCLDGPRYSVEQPDVVPAPRTVGMASGGVVAKDPGEEASEPETCLPMHMVRPLLLSYSTLATNSGHRIKEVYPTSNLQN